MTKKDALTAAIASLNATIAIAPADDEATIFMKDVVVTLQHMADQLSVKRVASDETKATRKAETAAKRAQIVDTVAPVLRDTFRKFEIDITAKELYEAAKDTLPSDFSVAKVQNILIREMAPELDKIDNGRGKPYTYRMKERA